MNENQMNRVYSDSKFNIQYYMPNNQDSNHFIQDNDSDSSILNLLDIESLDKTPEQTVSPYYSITEPAIANEQKFHCQSLAVPHIKSDSIDPQTEDILLSKLPQIVVVEKPSIQYQVLDQNYPSLTNSFKTYFNSPISDLLVVVLNTEKLVSYYQGYFAGTTCLSNELINLNGKYWKSLISNNDEIAWENHYRSVTEKVCSFDMTNVEFEMGPVIRCRLRASNQNQFNQQLNYFFVQPCSYMVQLNQTNQKPGQEFNMKDIVMHSNNIYMVSYIYIMRECDTECALKGSAAISLEKIIKDSIKPHFDNSNVLSDPSLSKQFNNPNQRISNVNPVQLSIQISSPSYINSNKYVLSVPLTYPLINDQLYSSKQRPQMQQHITQHCQPMAMIDNQYMSRGLPISGLEQNHQHYQSHYQVPQSSSTLQYILENRSVNYPNAKHIQNNPHHMLSQHNSIYQNTGQPNMPFYMPVMDHSLQTPSNCSLNPQTTYVSTRHLVPMQPNEMLLPSDQYYRNTPQIQNNDPGQHPQHVMAVMHSMPSSVNQNSASYYCSTTPSQSQPSMYVINSLPFQSQSNLPQYCNSSTNNNDHKNNTNDMMTTNNNLYQGNQMKNTMKIKQESDDVSFAQKNWHSSQLLLEDSIATTYNGTMTNDSISFDIVEEILKAEEEKSEKKQTKSIPNSDNSDCLSFDIDDLRLLDQKTQLESSNNVIFNATTNIPVTMTSDFYDNDCTKCSTKCSNTLNSSFSLKSETMKKFNSGQKAAIRNLVEQHKNGKLTKDEMLIRINDFVSQIFGKNSHERQVIEFWKTQHPNVDSTLSNRNCSHVVQSPEEGPGISPTEQAAQSTTDMEDDKDICRHISRLTSKKYKDESLADLAKQRRRSKSTTYATDASIYSISSTTSTGVLETLLNEHDNPINSEKAYINSFSSRISVSSASKNQLSLDQLLMDEECSMLAGFNTGSQDDQTSRRRPDNISHQCSSKNTSQPTTPSFSSNIGVLESLLNQRNPSMYRIRQKSTENILKHSKSSQQNSVDHFHEETVNATDSSEKDNGMQKNSLLITLLNKSTGNSTADKYNTVNFCMSNSNDVGYSVSQPKRQRTISGANLCRDNKSKVKNENIDVFDFVDSELHNKTTEFQSGTITSSHFQNDPKTQQCKRSRKRWYSKEMTVDSDVGCDKALTKSTITNDKKTLLISLLDNTKSEDLLNRNVCPNNDNFDLQQSGNNRIYEDNIDFDEIKIDDFDLEHLIDVSESSGDSNVKDAVTSKAIMSCDQSFDASNGPVYTMAPPVVKVSQSEPIVQISKPSVVQLSEKNSGLIFTMQPTLSASSVSIESLDNERGRLLKQQQQQKVYIGGRYVSLNPHGLPDVDLQVGKMTHTLSLDLLSKQMKEVVPNVMVEPSNNVESVKLRRGSYSQITLTSPNIMTESTDNKADIRRQFPQMSSQVNHQQVREGLRLLVSNRSAQNSSKNNANSQRSNGELMSPKADYNTVRSSIGKSLIHYHSDAQISSNRQVDETSTSYSMSNVYSENISSNESRSTNILEDSLVNDVFELEELVKGHTSHSSVEVNSYQHSLPPRSGSEFSLSNNDNGPLMPVLSDMNASLLPSSSKAIGQPYHHHHLPHYHHHHPPATVPHHHNSTTSVFQSPNDAVNTVSTGDKQTVNSNSGLLETLLSR